MKNIFYVSYYAEPENPEKRVVALSAKNKMDYICDALIRLGYFVQIISASVTWDNKKGFKGKTVHLKKGLLLRTVTTVPWGNMLQKATSLLLSQIGLIRQLSRVKKNEKVIVYHSLGYMGIIDLIHRIKQFHLMLEVEEVYSDVIGNARLREKEIRFLQSADSYIFPTGLLDALLNTNRKPAVIIHGTYQVEKKRNNNAQLMRGQTETVPIIHCVYAGTLDPRKGGAEAAAAAAEYLPEYYHIHIIGFGSEEEINSMKKLAERISGTGKNCARVTYDGLLSGEEYIRFIQSCDIGLSTQNPEAAFNDTSFPSKILSYLANGLRVVSIRIPAIEQSAVSNVLYYYDEQTSDQIAKAIMSVDLNREYDSRKLITDLAEKFENELNELLEK